MRFGKNAIIGLDHGGKDQSSEHNDTLAYWYGVPQATLVETDELKNRQCGKRSRPTVIARYRSPQASGCS